MGTDAVCVLRLPPLSESDPLFSEKMPLLHARNKNLEFQLSDNLPVADALDVLNEMVQASRILQMDEMEMYFLEEEDDGPFSFRNEILSLNVVLSSVKLLHESNRNVAHPVLQSLLEECLNRITCFGSNKAEKMILNKNTTEREETLLKWAENNGVQTKLLIAFFEGAGRGAVAIENLFVGDIALEIPEAILISELLLRDSDMFQVLEDLDEMTTDMLLVFWSMNERYNSDSRFKTYFDSLPNTFNTGLSFGIDAIAALEGTLLLDEILQAREHLHKQYEVIFQQLQTKFPDIFHPNIHSWEHFLWACELWYSNSMKVVFSDGQLRTCLVPVAGLLNHSVSPHIYHYGKVDATSKSLKFIVSRPCHKGEQCYMNYGSFSGLHLVTFYGFLPDKVNPYDVILLDIDAGNANVYDQHKTEKIVWPVHMVRGTWLSKRSGIYSYGLPTSLLSYLRANLVGDDKLSKEGDRKVLEVLYSVFLPMLEALDNSESSSWEDLSWDVKLAMKYKGSQQKIISSVLSSCSVGLKLLQEP